MTDSANKYGLSRDMGDPLRRVVRQECFNGCVVCGALPYTYEHFNPVFVDCHEHRAEGIALLCGNCHVDTTAGRLSKPKIAEKRLNPANREQSAKWKAVFEKGDVNFEVGTNRSTGHNVGISVNGRNVISLSNFDDDEWSLYADFKDLEGQPSLKIVANEIIVGREVWDFEMSGKSLTVRTAKSAPVALEIEFDAENRVIRIPKLAMRVDQHSVLELSKGALVWRDGVGSMSFSNCFDSGFEGSYAFWTSPNGR